MMPALILLERLLAIELACVPVATIVVGGAVVWSGCGVVNTPPMITGMRCVVPDTTLVTVEMTGC